jgi:ABC-type cobalamin transport system permease subunit
MAEIDPVKARSARQLRSLCLAVAAGIVYVLAIRVLLGFRQLTLHSLLTVSAIPFALLVPVLWVLLSRPSDVTVRMALTAIAIIFIVAGFAAWRYWPYG